MKENSPDPPDDENGEKDYEVNNEYDECEETDESDPIEDLLKYDELAAWSNSECIMSMVEFLELNYGQHPLVEKLIALLAYLEELTPRGFEDLNRSDILMAVRLCRTTTNYIDEQEEENARLCVFMVTALFSQHLRDGYLSALDKFYLDSINYPHIDFVKLHWN